MSDAVHMMTLRTMESSLRLPENSHKINMTLRGQQKTNETHVPD